MSGWLALRLSAATVLATVVGCTLAGIGQSGGLTPADGDQPGARTRAVVDRVVDGDTVRVRTRDGQELPRVRILGIDAPEVAHPGTAGECYGDRATGHLTTLLAPGTPIVLEADPTQDGTDAYGRLLRYVEVDGRDVGLAQIRSGSAQAREDYPPVRRLEDYLHAQATAREQGEGCGRHVGRRSICCGLRPAASGKAQPGCTRRTWKPSTIAGPSTEARTDRIRYRRL